MADDIFTIGSLWLRQERNGVSAYDRDRDRFLFFPDADRNALSGCRTEDEALAALPKPDRIASRAFEYPLRIGWMLTSRCNLDCVYCIAQDKMDPKAKNDDPMGTADHILSLHPLSVVISGGEPTLHGARPAVLDRLAGKTALILDSNGTVPFHEDLIDALRRADASVRISIDSFDPAINGALRPNRNPDADDLSAIEANLLRLLREHIFTSVHTVVTTVNRAALFGLEERLASTGIRRWHLYGLLAAGRGKACFPALHVGAEALSMLREELQSRFPDMRITFSLPSETGAGGTFPIADSAGRFFVEPDGCALVYPGKDPKRPTAKELGDLRSDRYC